MTNKYNKALELEAQNESRADEVNEHFVSLRNINKFYDKNVHAVVDFNLDIKKREFIVFVGPSGCGKSTTLRMIAGLEDISSGELYIDGELANDLVSKDRDIAMVFHSYDFCPNLTVYDNLAFSLKVRHFPKEEIDKRVHEYAKILEIEDYLKRKPKALSGGQRQRVALGRAIVRKARLFLMDEPLSNLDAKLRVQMRSEIIKLHDRIKATTIYVTHDQTEAMTMADRIVVMKNGYIQQIGTPIEIYRHPTNKFVASFIGSPAMNFVDVKYDNGKIIFPDGTTIDLPKSLVEKHDEFYAKQLELEQNNYSSFEEGLNSELSALKSKGHTNKNTIAKEEDIKAKITAKQEYISKLKQIVNKEQHDIIFGIRPESIIECNEKEGFETVVDLPELLGDEYYVHFTYGGASLLAKISTEDELDENTPIRLKMIPEKIHLFDKDTELAIK